MDWITYLRRMAVIIDTDATPSQVGPTSAELRDAGNEIARLQADNERLRAALVKITEYFERGAVKRGADANVPTIARAALAQPPRQRE